MERINLVLFSLFNGPARPDHVTWFLARLFAEWLIWIAAIGFALGYLRSGRAGRVAIIRTGMATALALAANFAIAALWYHPRPFELGVGHQLLPRAAETSFPSDHGTVLFSVAFGLIAFGARRVWWVLALSAAFAVAWARVWLGVHWPLDMAGSIAVAAIAVLAVRGVAGLRAVRKVDQLILGLTDAVLAFLHVPPSVAPRLADTKQPTVEPVVRRKPDD